MTAAPAPDLGTLTRSWARESLLGSMKAERREADALARRQLLRVTEWADLHRTDAVESFSEEGVLPGHEDLVFSIDMSGVPVGEFCLAELSAAMGISQGTARRMTEDALEGRERLPRLWSQLEKGRLAAWRLREVAQHTRSLSDAAADYVDAQLAPFARTLTTTRIKNLVTVAIQRFDPERAAAEAEAAAEKRGVWFDLEHGTGDQVELSDCRPDGNGRAEIVASTPDLLAFKDALTQKAGELKVLGDDSSQMVRMSKAVGVLADPQHALDLSATVEEVLAEEHETGTRPAVRRPAKHRPVFGGDRPIHIHLHTSSQTARVQSTGLPHAASPLSRPAVEQWLADLAPGVRVKVTPVVDLNRTHAVDQHEAPDHLRSQVEERDDTCVFPFCTNRGRFDLDHVIEYVDPDRGGPPGQTSNRNLAKLCRYHHRAKTHTTWTYRRVESIHDLDTGWPDPGPATEIEARARSTINATISADDVGGPPPAYSWTSPLGLHYLVTPTGTYPLD